MLPSDANELDPSVKWVEKDDEETTHRWAFLKTFANPATEMEFRRSCMIHTCKVHGYCMTVAGGLQTLAFLPFFIFEDFTKDTIRSTRDRDVAVWGVAIGAVLVAVGLIDLLIGFCLPRSISVQRKLTYVYEAIHAAGWLFWMAGSCRQIFIETSCGPRKPLYSPHQEDFHCRETYRFVSAAGQFGLAYSYRGFHLNFFGQFFHTVAVTLATAFGQQYGPHEWISRCLISAALGAMLLYTNRVRERTGRLRFAQLVRFAASEGTLARHHKRVAAIIRAALPDKVALRLASLADARMIEADDDENADDDHERHFDDGNVAAASSADAVFGERSGRFGGEPSGSSWGMHDENLAVVQRTMIPGLDGRMPETGDAAFASNTYESFKPLPLSRTASPNDAAGSGAFDLRTPSPQSPVSVGTGMVRARIERPLQDDPWRDTTEHGAVCVTAVVNFGHVSCSNLTATIVTDLHRLFTLLDEATSIFDVDRSATYGDAYVVTSGVVRDSGTTVGNSLRFALWEMLLAKELLDHERSSLELHSCVASGAIVAGGMINRRYSVSGPAVQRALTTVKHVPPGRVWWADQHLSGPTEGGDGEDSLGGGIGAQSGSYAYTYQRPKRDAGTASSILDNLIAAEGIMVDECPTAVSFRCLLVKASPLLAQNLSERASCSVRGGDVDVQPASADELAKAAAALLNRREIRSRPSVDPVVLAPFSARFPTPALESEYRAWATKHANRAFSLVMLFLGACLGVVFAVAVLERVLHPDGRASLVMDIAGFSLLALSIIASFVMSFVYRRHGRTIVVSDPGETEPQNPAGTAASDESTHILPAKKLLALYAAVSTLAMGSLFLLRDNHASRLPQYIMFLIEPIPLIALGTPLTNLQGIAYGSLTVAMPLTVIHLWHQGPLPLVLYTPVAGVVVAVLVCRVGIEVRQTYAKYVDARNSMASIRVNVQILGSLVGKLVPPHAVEAGVQLVSRPSDDPEIGEELTRSAWDGLSAIGRLYSIRYGAAHLAAVSHEYSLLILVATRLYPLRGPLGVEERVIRTWERVAAIVASTGADGLFEIVQMVGDDFTVAGPLSPSDGALTSQSATSAIDLVRRLHIELNGLARFISVGVADEAVGALVGRHALRYRIFGVAAFFTQSLLETATAGLGSPATALKMGPAGNIAFFDHSLARLIEPDLGLDVMHKYVHLGPGRGAVVPPGVLLMPAGSSEFEDTARWRVAHVGLRTIKRVRLDPLHFGTNVAPAPTVSQATPAFIPILGNTTPGVSDGESPPHSNALIANDLVAPTVENIAASSQQPSQPQWPPQAMQMQPSPNYAAAAGGSYGASDGAGVQQPLILQPGAPLPAGAILPPGVQLPEGSAQLPIQGHFASAPPILPAGMPLPAGTIIPQFMPMGGPFASATGETVPSQAAEQQFGAYAMPLAPIILQPGAPLPAGAIFPAGFTSAGGGAAVYQSQMMTMPSQPGMQVIPCLEPVTLQPLSRTGTEAPSVGQLTPLPPSEVAHSDNHHLEAPNGSRAGLKTPTGSHGTRRPSHSDAGDDTWSDRHDASNDGATRPANSSALKVQAFAIGDTQLDAFDAQTSLGDPVGVTSALPDAAVAAHSGDGGEDEAVEQEEYRPGHSPRGSREGSPDEYLEDSPKEPSTGI